MMMIKRRTLLIGAGLVPALVALPARAQGTALRSIAVMDIELIDEHLNPATMADQERRLREARIQLQRLLAERGLYRVLDPEPAQALLTDLHAQQAFLYRCDDCVIQFGHRLGADLVMSSWVQKVSELILNFNVQVHDVAQQRLVLSKSVDMRGNNDVSWTRAVDYLVRGMAEKRAANPRYGN
ncbi:MAG: DUF3280 domain-containing protein [Burkholderiales bacterium]|nr:DUF3280 domain-containing protein [Burkholderiales bacterium]